MDESREAPTETKPVACPAAAAMVERMNAHAGSETTETPRHLHRRFDRMARLVGDDAMARLHRARVMVAGLGGVGSFVAESLARSGVGNLALVDFDKVCATNTNRQLQAMKGEIGKPKADVLADRLARVNPQANITTQRTFYDEETAESLFAWAPDFVVDAIDNVTAKCHLLAESRRRDLPVVCSTGAAGRIDPTCIRIADLAETSVDPLASAVRKVMRKRFGFPAEGSFGIPAVFSVEPAAQPLALAYDGGEGFRCVCPGSKDSPHSCEQRSVIYGTASFVTGVFGLYCASIVVRQLSNK